MCWYWEPAIVARAGGERCGVDNAVHQATSNSGNIVGCICRNSSLIGTGKRAGSSSPSTLDPDAAATKLQRAPVHRCQCP